MDSTEPEQEDRVSLHSPYITITQQDSERLENSTELWKDNIVKTFPHQYDMAVHDAVYDDLEQMAPVRFNALFGDIRTKLQEAFIEYDEAHPEIEKHMAFGESAVPNWEVAIGIKLDESQISEPQPMTQTVESMEELHDQLITSVMQIQEEMHNEPGRTEPTPIEDMSLLSVSYGLSSNKNMEERLFPRKYAYVSSDTESIDIFILISKRILQVHADESFYELSEEQWNALLRDVVGHRLQMIAQHDMQAHAEQRASPFGHMGTQDYISAGYKVEDTYVPESIIVPEIFHYFGVGEYQN